MAYVDRQTILTEIPPTYLVEALDDDVDGQEDPGAFDNLVLAVSRRIDGFLAGRYTVPFPDPAPATVSSAAFTFFCESVFRKRGVPPDANPYTKEADAMRSLLKRIANGEQPIDAAQTEATTRIGVVTDVMSNDAQST